MRAYYSDDETIICTSGDGITPIENSSVPQAKQCAICPQSIWGSRITPNGKRAKACTEYATLKLITLEESNRCSVTYPRLLYDLSENIRSHFLVEDMVSRT